MIYDLEIDKVVKTIKTQKAKSVCIQLPDGLKDSALDISQELEEKTGATIIIYMASCWGACDLPVGLDSIGVDLLVQWGHSDFGFRERLIKKNFVQIKEEG